MKSAISAFLCLVFSLFFSLAFVPALSFAESNDITLAAILPLSGNAADQGEWARRGFDLALAELRSKNNLGMNLEYEDSKGGDPGAAVNAYKGLSARNRPAVVFTYGSGVGLALSPLVNSDKVIQMGIATASPKYRSVGDFTFRNFPSASLEAQFVAAALRHTLKTEHIAIININNDYGVGTSQALRAAFTGSGGKVLGEESFDPGTTDFKPQLLKLKQLQAPAIYLAVYPTDGALLLKQARELGLKVPFIASVAIIGGKDFFSVAGDAAEGLLVASSMTDASSEFAKDYERKYPNESSAQSIYAARAYDALKIIGTVIASCKSAQADCIRDSLFKVHDYHGASGTVSFDEAGDITTDFALFRIHDRSFVPANPG